MKLKRQKIRPQKYIFRRKKDFFPPLLGQLYGRPSRRTGKTAESLTRNTNSATASRDGYSIFASGQVMTRPVQPQRNGPAHVQDAAGNRADACRRAHRRPEPFGSCPANLSRASLRVSSAANGTIAEDRNGHGKANKMTPAYDWAALPTKPRRHRRTKASRQANSRLRIFTCAHIAYYL